MITKKQSEHEYICECYVTENGCICNYCRGPKPCDDSCKVCKLPVDKKQLEYCRKHSLFHGKKYPSCMFEKRSKESMEAFREEHPLMYLIETLTPEQIDTVKKLIEFDIHEAKDQWVTDLLEKYDSIFSQGHGGGNYRRLVEQFRVVLNESEKETE